MAGCSSLFFVGVIILIGKLGRAGTIDGKQNERDIDVCGTGDANKTICLYRSNMECSGVYAAKFRYNYVDSQFQASLVSL